MVGMQTQFGRGRYVDVISNRTIQSGGSISGNKAGLWTGQPGMRPTNIGNKWTYRMPQTQPSVFFALRNTTRNPLQLRRGSYAVTHSGSLG